MSSSKKAYLYRDFAAGIFYSLYCRLEIQSAMLVFRPSFVNCCPSPFLSGSTLFPPPFPRVNTYYCIQIYSV